MEVLDFAKYRKIQPSEHTDRSPEGAIVDFQTSESGFEFLAGGKRALEAQEVDGCVRVVVPRKTKFLSISHPDYGKCLWKLPVKPRRFRHYSAYLRTYNPDKLFKLSRQYLVLDITPAEVIVHVDSSLTLVRDGRAQFNLPLGVHKYVVEAPFHTPVEDTVSLCDTGKLCRQICLQPFYSFLSVRVDSSNPQIYLDREFVGRGSLTTGRIAPGEHRLTALWDSLYFYDASLTVEPAQKKVVSLRKDVDAKPFWHGSRWKNSPAQSSSLEEEDPLEALARAIPEGGITKTTMQVPSDTAWLSIHSNVVGALVFVDGAARGLTPCIVDRVPGHGQCSITLSKDGYEPVFVTANPRSGDLTDVKIKMKEAKRK